MRKQLSFYIQLVSRTEKIQPANIQFTNNTTRIAVTLSHEHAPKCALLVWTVYRGEVIGDMIELNVGGFFRNNVFTKYCPLTCIFTKVKDICLIASDDREICTVCNGGAQSGAAESHRTSGFIFVRNCSGQRHSRSALANIRHHRRGGVLISIS